MRLEQFQNVLLPVEYIYQVEFIPRKSEYDYDYPHGRTIVFFKVPGSAYHDTVEFKGNQLKKFKAWYDSLNIESAPTYPPTDMPVTWCPSTIGPETGCVAGTTTTTTTESGTTSVTIVNNDEE